MPFGLAVVCTIDVVLSIKKVCNINMKRGLLNHEYERNH